MPNLTEVYDFRSLVAFLVDELDWPVDRSAFEDLDELTFEYDPEELGFPPELCAKVREVKQMRPLTDNQPWAVFYLSFESKRLPVIALRRILGVFVARKRAVSGDRATWQMQDLLFVNSHGGDEERAMTFAHFTPPESGYTAVMREFMWSRKETHLAHIHRYLDCLHWPEDGTSQQEWRKRWRSAFVGSKRKAISDSRALAEEMAHFAYEVRQRVTEVLELTRKNASSPLQQLFASFQKLLIHDMKENDFADAYAQTMAYGLFVARASKPDDEFALRTVPDNVPPTNPFLRGLFRQCLGLTSEGAKKIDIEELGVRRLVELFTSLQPDDMKRILDEFGSQTGDPVIHFYEDFLSAYDKAKKVQRGVFYTPQPVVRYIVLSVHELLQTEFGLEDGLADTTTWGEMVKRNKDLKKPDGVENKDPFVLILDPATGTATFLVEVTEVIFTHLKKKWADLGKKPAEISRLWNEYVPKNLLPRLYGYELMMAPYTIAHMKLALKLQEINARLGQLGLQFETDNRANIYLTNSLDEPDNKQRTVEGVIPALAEESVAVNWVKKNKRFTVVIGNPPYAGHSSNTGDWITQLVDDYYAVDGKPLGERNPKWLQDDYVKFIRLGQHLLSQTGCGIQSYITNHGYIENPTFRGMRQQLMAAFSAIDLLDLHGNTTKKEVCPDGSEDVNVFDIKQGVAIFAARRQHVQRASSCAVQHADIFGTWEKKNDQLAAATFSRIPLNPVHPSTPFYLFVPQDSDLEGEYTGFQKMTDAMPVNVLGFQTHRDEVAVAFDADNLLRQVKNYLGRPPQKRDWDRLQSPCTYRLFDVRAVYLHTDVCDRPRRELLDHVVHRDNVSIGLGRQGVAVQDPIWSLVTASRFPTDANIFRRGGINIFPLYLYPEADGLAFDSGRRSNFSGVFLDTVAAALSLPQKVTGGIPCGLAPEDILHYAYTVFHSPTYRTRYAAFLKIDFPRLPLTSSLDLFRALAKLGGELVALHLMESPKLVNFITNYAGPKDPEVTRVGWSDETVWIDASATKKGQPAKPGTIGFEGVPEEVWNFHIGGYQVCEKWLKDRKGRTLSDDDINHYQKIVVALSETIRIMAEIDKVIDAHGGWPAAFQTGDSKTEKK